MVERNIILFFYTREPVLSGSPAHLKFGIVKSKVESSVTLIDYVQYAYPLDGCSVPPLWHERP